MITDDCLVSKQHVAYHNGTMWHHNVINISIHSPTDDSPVHWVFEVIKQVSTSTEANPMQQSLLIH